MLEETYGIILYQEQVMQIARRRRHTSVSRPHAPRRQKRSGMAAEKRPSSKALKTRV